MAFSKLSLLNCSYHRLGIQAFLFTPSFISLISALVLFLRHQPGNGTNLHQTSMIHKCSRNNVWLAMKDAMPDPSRSGPLVWSLAILPLSCSPPSTLDPRLCLSHTVQIPADFCTWHSPLSLPSLCLANNFCSSGSPSRSLGLGWEPPSHGALLTQHHTGGGEGFWHWLVPL
jgi:hypothetical protein